MTTDGHWEQLHTDLTHLKVCTEPTGVLYLTNHIHVPQGTESPCSYFADAVVMDTHLNKRRGQVARDGGEQVVGNVELLQALQRQEGTRVNMRDQVTPQD